MNETHMLIPAFSMLGAKIRAAMNNFQKESLDSRFSRENQQ
jgi:hypothetical protein